ncbi:MAG: molybdate ABC transporter substrate-binding protein [Sedimenticola sp.]|nr:molybdate ABC transporter substrate-binding protein [Sedimenticola sp.]
MRCLLCRIYLLLLVISALLIISPVHAAEITLAVANSTCKTIKAVGEQYARSHNIKIHYLCKSSGLLAKGIRGGAIKAEIYISANRHWVDYMIKGGLVTAENVTTPWGNRLVVSAPINSPLRLQTWHDLTSESINSIIIGDPGTAPFGRYAKQALQKTGIWEQVKQKITTTKHITLLAEKLAQSDNKTVGILFATNLTDRLRPLYSIDPSWHPAIRYFMAPVGQSADNAEVTGLFNYLQSDPVFETFKAAGFDVTSE